MDRIIRTRVAGLGLAVVALFILFLSARTGIAQEEPKCDVDVQVLTSKNIETLWGLIDGKQVGTVSHYRGLKTNKYARVRGVDPDRYPFFIYNLTLGSYVVTIKKPDVYVADEGKLEGEVLLTFTTDIQSDYSSLSIVFNGFDESTRQDTVSSRN